MAPVADFVLERLSEWGVHRVRQMLTELTEHLPVTRAGPAGGRGSGPFHGRPAG